jgi:hypothetical protein
MESIKGLHFEEWRKEIAFDAMEAADSILIRTRSSTYRFLVVDPSLRRGLLSGGKFGDHPCDAILAATLSQEPDGLRSDASGLKVQSRALFYIRVEDRLDHLLTSAITDLDHIKCAAP